jgi:hypothetical protein
VTVIDSERKIAIIVMWGFLAIFGIAGLVLASLNSPRNLPIALGVVIGGAVVATTVTLLVRHSFSGAPAERDDADDLTMGFLKRGP